MGLDRPVYLNLYQARIKTLHTAARVDEHLRTSLSVSVEVEGRAEEIHVRVIGPDGQEHVNERLDGATKAWDFDAELWWPVNEGRQALYDVEVDLRQSVCRTYSLSSFATREGPVLMLRVGL
jgi:beta-mannosidase